MSHRRRAHPGVTAELAQIEDRAGPGGDQGDEPVEGGEIADSQEVSDVAFEVGLDVAGEPERAMRPAKVWLTPCINGKL